MIAAAADRQVKVFRHRSELGNWEMVFGEPAPGLKPYVQAYCAYDEQTPGPMRRRELPAPKVVIIIELGPTLRILNPSDYTILSQKAGGFVAGIDDSFSLTETAGQQRGIEVNLTLLGAQQIFRMPMTALAHCVIGLDEAFGVEGRVLRQRLEEAPDCASRFALLDGFFWKRVNNSARLNDWVGWAWRQIEGSGGTVPIEELVKELGFSRKHVAERFHERFGLAPKALARLVRFDRVIRALQSGRYADWTEIALEHGYFDQAHFIREFRRFSGGTPSDYLVRRLADNGGVRG